MTLSSTLESVTVYREGAVCVRRAQVTGADRSLRIGGIPLSAEPGSLRAKVIAGQARVVDIRPQFDVQVLDEVDVPAEQKALDAAREALEKLQVRKTRLDAEIDELRGLRPRFLEPKRGDAPREAPVNSMISFMEFTDAELSSRQETRRALEQAIDDARRDYELRTARLAEASSARRTERARLTRVAVVTLAQAPTGVVMIELEYQVPGVRWVPNYQLKLERGLSTGTLLLRASIAQNTGEDWRNVQLALSTASLSRRTEVPELKALKIGRRQSEPPKSGWREPPPGLAELFASFDAAAVVHAPPQLSKPAPGGRNQPSTVPFAEFAADKAKKDESSVDDDDVPVMSPPPSAAPMPQGKPMRSRAAMPPPQAMMTRSMPSKGGFGGAVLGAIAAPAGLVAGAVDRLRQSNEMEKEAMEDLMPDEMSSLGGAFDEGGLREESAVPSGPDAALLDYSRLVMLGVEHPSSRGKLQPAGAWDSMFMLGVSVQIDVVMVAISKARNHALAVQSLGLPAMCNPVSAIESFDYRYDCEARADVASTGKWVNVAVASCPVGLTPEYVCVPSVEPKVYRTLQITNRSAHALLSGPVDVSAGDEFLMTTMLPAIPPRNELPYRLGLGVEEAIKVARKTQFKESPGGFLGGSTLLPHDIEIEVNNRLSTPALLEVRERIPWVDPEDEKDVKVEEQQVQPAWEKFDKPIDGGFVVRGARRWRVTVPAGQAMKLTAQFTIRIPSDRMVVGGNRRS